MVMTARLCGAALGLVLQLVLVKWLGAYQFGVYVIALSAAGLLAGLCGLGFPSVTARFITQYRKAGDQARLKGFIRSARRHIAIVAGLAALPASLLLYFNAIPTPSDWKVPLMIACACAPVMAFMRFNGALANINKRFALSYLPDLVVKPALFLSMIMALGVFWDALSIETALLTHLSALATIAIAQAWRLKGIGACTYPQKTENSAWRKASVPMMLVYLLTTFLTGLDILLLGLLLPADQVAVFSICLRLMLLVEFGVIAVFQLATPDIAAAHAAQDRQKLASTITLANLLNGALSLGAFAGACLFGRTILSLFGGEFEAGYPILLILMAAPVMRALAGPATQLLTLGARQLDCLWIHALAFAALAAANLALVPAMGLTGAALAFLGSISIGSVCTAWFACHKLGVQTTLLTRVKAAIFAGLPATR